MSIASTITCVTRVVCGIKSRHEDLYPLHGSFSNIVFSPNHIFVNDYSAIINDFLRFHTTANCGGLALH